jgi:Transposase IS4
VYLDRYFTSLSLLDELLANGIRACGTVRKDRRDLPKDFKSAGSQLSEHEWKYWQRRELGALVWKDRRLVYLLTTHISPADTTTVERRSEDRSIVQRSVPTAVADYNQHKSGVDTIDQLHASYSIGRKSKKWWPRLVWWLIDMCIINAYSLYQHKQQVQITQLEFRQQLMQQLVEQHGQKRSNVGRPSSTPHKQQQQGHWPEHIEERGDCMYCRMSKNQRTRIRSRCKC